MTASPDVKEAVERLEKLASISKFVVTTVKTADLHTILARLRASLTHKTTKDAQ